MSSSSKVTIINYTHFKLQNDEIKWGKKKTKTNLNEPNVKILYPYVIEIHRKESTHNI